MLLFVFKIFIILPFFLFAEDPSWQTRIGTVSMRVPAFKGADSFKWRIFPFISWRYADTWSLGFDGLSYQRSFAEYYEQTFKLAYSFGQKPQKSLRRKVPFAFKGEWQHRIKWKYLYADLSLQRYFASLWPLQLVAVSIGHGIYIPWVRVFGSLSFKREWSSFAYASRYYGHQDTPDDDRDDFIHYADSWSLTFIKPFHKRYVLLFPLTFKRLSPRLNQHFALESRFQPSLLMILSYQL